MSYPTKGDMLHEGQLLMATFCKQNKLQLPTVINFPRSQWRVKFCAYYRPIEINICKDACAAVGTGGRAWSYPGYSVDRTPYGVVQHELGHHADCVLSTKQVTAYYGDFSDNMRKESGEERLTSYCPNSGEWFAEMFRLFVTNPDLLEALRPRTCRLLEKEFQPVVGESWQMVLSGAPERTFVAAQRKVDEAARKCRGTRGKLF